MIKRVMISALLTWCVSVTAALAEPRLVVESLESDFGSVARGTVVEETFLLRNVGTAPLELKSMNFSAPGMRARVDAVIAPGAEAPLTVEFDTSRHVRDVAGEAMLELNDPNVPRVVFKLTGYVVVPIEILPVPAVYLSQFQGEAASQTLTIQSNQPHAVAVTGMQARGDSFTTALETVDAGRTYRLTVSAKPDLPIGRIGERVLVYFDDPSQERLAVEVNILVKPDVFVATDGVSFGRIDRATLHRDPSVIDLHTQSFIVTRRDDTMRITGADSDLPFVTIAHTPESSARTFQIDVGLDATRLTEGAHTGRILLRTDDPDFPVVSVPVSAFVD